MFIRVLSIIFFVFALPALAEAQTWTSPDGLLSIEPPDAKEFEQMPTPPAPFVGLWVSRDQKMRFGVMKSEIPLKVRLMHSSVEEGLAEQVDGEVTRLPTKDVDGYEVWTMTAKGESLEITQAMMRHDGALYKLLAVTVGGNPDSAAVDHFIDSLSIVQSPQTNTEPSKQGAQPLRELGVDRHNLSRTWTSDKGHTVTATLVEHSRTTIKLKKETGKIVELKTSRLSTADLKHLSSLKERVQEMGKQRVSEKSTPVAPKAPISVLGGPEVTEDDLLEMGREFELFGGGSIKSPFKHGFKSEMLSSKFRWNNRRVPSFEVVNSKKDSIEKIEMWNLGSVEGNDRQKLVETANQFLKEQVKDKYGQFSTEPPIQNWLKADGTVDGGNGGKVIFRQYLYFGDKLHLFLATAGSPERILSFL